MGFISDIVTDVATNVINDTRDKLAVSAIVGAATAVTGAVTGVVKGVEAAGQAAVATKNAVVDAKNSVEGFIDTAAQGTRAVVDKALEATVGDKDTRHYRRELRYLSKIAHCPNVIVQMVEDEKDIFRIYDAEENLIFRVCGQLYEGDFLLSVFSEENVPVAEIYKTQKTSRGPIFRESKPADYVIALDEEPVAILKTKLTKTKAKEYDVEPMGWTGLDQKKDISLSNEHGVIIHASRRKGYGMPTYILDFWQEEYQLVSLLLMLTIIAREFE